MDLILVNEGSYQLVTVTKEMMAHISLSVKVNCFELCDILRLYLTTYYEPWNIHVMNDDSGYFIGCVCN